jgi:hypothetical protein
VSGAQRAYDPIPDLARLLGSAQRLLAAPSAGPGFTKVVTRLTAGLELPELARLDETELAIREALRSFITPAGRLMPAAELDELAAEAERGYDVCGECEAAAPAGLPLAHRMDCSRRGYDPDELPPIPGHAGPGHTADGPTDCRRCQMLRDNAHWMALPARTQADIDAEEFRNEILRARHDEGS